MVLLRHPAAFLSLRAELFRLYAVCYPSLRRHSRGLVRRETFVSLPSLFGRRRGSGSLMEKRVLLAAVISAVLLSLYSQVFIRHLPQTTAPAETVAPAEQYQATPSPVEAPELKQEPVAILANKEIELAVGLETGQVRSVILKQFNQTGTSRPLEISGKWPIAALSFESGISDLHANKVLTESISFDAKDGAGNNYNILYVIDLDKPILDLRISKIQSIENVSTNVLLYNSWSKADESNGQSNILQVKALTKKSNAATSYVTVQAKASTLKTIPRGTILLSLSERYFCQSIKPIETEMSVTVLPSQDHASLITRSMLPSDPDASVSIFFGSTDYFHLKSVGFERAFPIGAIGQIGLMLLAALSMVASVTHNYGVAIIVFSAFITCATAPFTVLSYRSMRKMQELKPRIDKIMAEHKNDSAAANKQVFQLYREHKVNPLSGCLPLLLQMPILIAMFQAISHFIELRGKSFLWISDLSMPDRFMLLPFSIPLLGREVNILPVVMSVLMYFQTKQSQVRLPASDQANPAAAMMSGPIMPVIFCVMFYHFPSSLVLYWLTNSAMSMLWYRASR